MNRWIRKAVPIGVLAAGFLLATGTAASADNAGIGNGNTVSTTIQAPVNVCGNSTAVLGFSSASCSGGAVAINGGASSSAGGSATSNGVGSSNSVGTHHRRHHHHHGTGGGSSNSVHSNSVGHRAHSTSVTHRAHSNGATWSSVGTGTGTGGAWAVNNGTTFGGTGNNAGIGNGNQYSTVVQTPVNVCGNSVALLGFSSASC